MNILKIAAQVAPAFLAAALFALPASSQEVGLWSAAQKAGVLRCGAAEGPPYLMKNPSTGEITGLFADLCREFADVLKVKMEFVDTNWDNMIAGLQAKKWDLVPSLTATPQRALSITFSKNVIQTENTLVYNKTNPKISSPKSIADIDKAGVTIAVTSGTAQDKSISAAIKNATVMRLPGPDEIRLAVMSKRADFVMDTLAANSLFAGANPGWAAVLKPVPALDKKGVSFGLRRETSPADLQVLDIFITDQIASGHIDELFQKATAQASKKD